MKLPSKARRKAVYLAACRRDHRLETIRDGLGPGICRTWLAVAREKPVWGGFFDLRKNMARSGFCV